MNKQIAVVLRDQDLTLGKDIKQKLQEEVKILMKIEKGMNTKITHDQMVEKLCKSGADILKDLTPSRVHLLHMASKLCSEAGELMDAVGKLCYYNKPLDQDNVVEELGDMEFYMSGIRQCLTISRETILLNNMDKLSKRYEGFKYSDKAAKQRKDKL